MSRTICVAIKDEWMRQAGYLGFHLPLTYSSLSATTFKPRWTYGFQEYFGNILGTEFQSLQYAALR